MQGPPGPWSPQPDPGAMALRTMSDAGEIGTIATAQLLGGLSGLMVSEGLARVVREILGAAPGPAKSDSPATDAAAEPAAPEAGGEREALAGLSANALKELVAQGVVGRIVALNSLNTYLSLAAAEQLRRIGAQLASGSALPPVEGAALVEGQALLQGTALLQAGAGRAQPPAQAQAQGPVQAPPGGARPPYLWPAPYMGTQPGPVFWSQLPPPYYYPGRR